jgi:hypothetical protein
VRGIKARPAARQVLDRPEFDYLGFAIYSNIFGFNATVGNNGAQGRLGT